jgi:3-hydroxyisobutyrate dehydrogenase-like beta-hydroxyacid dehydrogenase
MGAAGVAEARIVIDDEEARRHAINSNAVAHCSYQELGSSASPAPGRLLPSMPRRGIGGIVSSNRVTSNRDRKEELTMTTLGFVGLGHMGGNMAARFLAAGYTVYGEERNQEQAEGLVREGLGWRDTPREVAESADVLFTSLPDDAVLESVASGPDGILAALTAPKIWVDMSTVSPRVSRELAERVRAGGATMLDAPVSGSIPQVQSGTLTIMVGGDEAAYARVEPILRELGTPRHVGKNGQGLVLKLAINISLAVQMLAFSEGLLLSERAGIDPKLAVDVMTQSPIGSPMLKARADLVLDLPHEAWFDVGMMQKDVALALDTGRELRVPLPSADAADTVLTIARASGYERRDIAALFEVLAHLTSNQVRSPA